MSAELGPDCGSGGICGSGGVDTIPAMTMLTELHPDITALQKEWPKDRVDALRTNSALMNNAALAQAMMRRTPVSPDKPIVPLGVNYIEGSSCHTHTRDGIGSRAAAYMRMLGVSPDTYYLTGVNDGITNGFPQMGYSNPNKDAIANVVQNRMRSTGADGGFVIPACDKGFPGAIMGLLLANVPSVVLPAGSSKTGIDPLTGEPLGILSVFHADAQHQQGQITDKRLRELQENAIQIGNCNGVFTADTMASLNEVLGLGVIGSANNLAETVETDRIAIDSIGALLTAMEAHRKPRDIVTKKAMDNAMTLLATIGGSTNAVLHMLAIAQVARVDYSYHDMQPIFRDTPFRLEMQPNSPNGYWQDFVEIGGVRRVIGHLLREGRLHPDVVTLNGKTVAELYEDEPPIDEFSRSGKAGTQKYFAIEQKDDMLPFSHIQILEGNLASEGAVAKVNSVNNLHFKGAAIVFEGEQEALDALSEPNAARLFAGRAVVVRGLGPKVGMPELLKVDKALQNLKDMAGNPVKTLLISDARQSGGAGHPNVTHVAPEARAGGVIGVVKDGDIVEIDIEQGTANVLLDSGEIAERMKNTPYVPPVTEFDDDMDVHRALVGSAAQGATLYSNPVFQR